MIDIPQIFALDEDSIRRKDNPLIPRKVIREALVNALMHRDYRVSSPVQIIKYANRTEFRNSGYSLKPQEQLGLPGSIPRNEVLAQVFHDIHYAEAKGTGIGTMRDEMKKANLSVPLIESDRASNLFVLTLLPHHLFDKKDIDWLSRFKSYNLSDDDTKTLIVIREKGSMTNGDYRTIHSVDTLTASSHLRRLRDYGLLEQKGRGNATYYEATQKLLTGDIEISTPHISPLYGELPNELKKGIANLKKRTPPKEVKKLIKDLCAVQPLKLSELSALLGRHPKYIREHYLNDMIKSQELEHVLPDLSHPQQAYQTKKP